LTSGANAAQAAAHKQAGAAAQPKQMTPAEVVAGWKAGRKILPIDIRTPAEYRAAHPQDAINVPLRIFRVRFKELQVPKQTEVLIIALESGAAARALRELAQMGYAKTAWVSSDEWKKSGFRVERSEPPPRTKR